MTDFSKFLNTAVRDADASRKRIDRLAQLLADELAFLNGGDWRTQIDHDAGLLLISRRNWRRT